MAENLPGISGLLFLLAIAPAALFVFRSRALLRSLDDAALPERLLSAQQRSGQITGTVVILLIVASPRALWWTLPLMILAQVTAGYPMRKRLFEETWSLFEYVWFVTRLTVGIWGFWIALAALPFVPYLAGRFDWLALPALALTLSLWNTWYGSVVRRLLRARPLEDATLQQRFAALAQACGLPAPRFEQVNLGGGVIANAIALPGLRGSSVVFTDALLKRLDPAEAAAICAHELAHLEYYNPKRLRQLNISTYGLIVLGIALALVRKFWEIDWIAISLVWVAGFVAPLLWRARDRQRQETVCDQRAVALCGDVETVARALTKIHASARLPRRFDGELERHATHPSLARRLRDIRAAAGATPASLNDARTFTSADGKTELTFSEDRLQWREGTHALHSLAYDYLSELRLQVAIKGRASLVAVEKAGRRWETSIDDGDIARLQSTLDVVDERLGGPTVAAGLWPRIAKPVLSCAAIVALLLGQFAAAVMALIVVLQSGSPILAGAGAAAIAAAGLSFRSTEIFANEVHIPASLLLAVIGIALLWAAQSSAQEPLPARARLSLTLIAFCAGISTAAWLMNGIDPVNLHLSGLAFPGAAIFLVALAGTLFCWPSRWARPLSVPVALVGILSAATGSTLFLDTFGRDPFLGDAAPIAWRTVDDVPIQEFNLPFQPLSVRLSPAGRSVLLTSSSPADDYRQVFHVGRIGGTLSRLVADEVVFVNDDRVLVLDAGEEESEIREVSIDTPEHAVWQRRVSDIIAPELSYRPSAGSWQLVGVDTNGGIVRATGRAADEPVDMMRWSGSDDRSRWPHVVATAGPNAVVVETRYPMVGDTRMWMLLSLLQGLRSESHLGHIDPSGYHELGRTRFMTFCHAVSSDDRMLCSVFDGTRSRFAALDPATSSITPLAWLHGRFAGESASQDGWMSGWLDTEPVAIHPGRREGIRAGIRSGNSVMQVLATGNIVGIVGYRHGGAVLHLYRHAEIRRAAR